MEMICNDVVHHDTCVAVVEVHVERAASLRPMSNLMVTSYGILGRFLLFALYLNLILNPDTKPFHGTSGTWTLSFGKLNLGLYIEYGGAVERSGEVAIADFPNLPYYLIWANFKMLFLCIRTDTGNYS